MKNKDFNKGIALTALASFWWGIIGVIYFKYISFVGHIEVVIHRTIWTSLTLIVSTFYLSKWNIFFDIVKNFKNLVTLFFSGVLIFINWESLFFFLSCIIFFFSIGGIPSNI